MLKGCITAVVDAAPEPVEAVAAFPLSTLAGWQAMRLSGLDDVGRFSPNLGCFLLRWADQIVLCDAGIGPGPHAYFGGLRGHLLDALARCGVAPEQVSAVVFTHLHMDHIGWATTLAPDGRRVPSFPNAGYFVAAPELDYWAAGAAGAKAHHRDTFDTVFRPLMALDQLVAVPDDRPFLAGASLLATPGHTPGHASILFRQGDERLVVAGDIFHCPGQVERPEWCHRADMDPDRATVTRRAFNVQAASEGWLVAAGHFRNGLQFGTIAPEGDRHRYWPVDGAVVAPSTIVHQGSLT